jgi:hypothetical protein
MTTDNGPGPEAGENHVPADSLGTQAPVSSADQLLRLGRSRAEKLPPHMRQIRERNVQLWEITDQSAFEEEADTWIAEIRDGNQAGSPGLKALRRDDGTEPHVSIVVPAHDEERYILQLLQSIAAQNYDKGVEVVVVDNNSDPNDRTASFAERCGARVIKYTVPDDDPDKELSQIALARQKGLEKATGGIVISTDADVIAPEGWIDAMTAPLDQDSGTKVVTGDIKYYDMPRILAGQNWARTIGRKALTIYSNNNMFRRMGKSSGNGANTAFRRNDALDLRGYDTNRYPGEDTDLAHRLSEGARMKFVTENAKVRVSPRRYEGMGAAAVVRVLIDYTSAYVGSQGPTNRR